MKGRQVSAIAIASVVFACSSPQFASAQALRRTVYASALDQSGAPVADLGPADFVVREDKVAREILSVAPAADPMQIVLLIDNSQASQEYIRDYRVALPAFIEALAADPSGAKHQVAIVTLAERPTINTDYTFDLARAVSGAQRIFAASDSGTYLLDGIIETSQEIVKRESPRPVMIVITTEGPELSGRQHISVLEPLRASGASLHVISVGAPVNNEAERGLVIAMGTQETGGRNETILTGSALTSRLKQVAAELTHQYRITYARPDTLIPPEDVGVSSARSGLTVRGIAIKTPRERP